jgi:hypothetical protein
MSIHFDSQKVMEFRGLVKQSNTLKRELCGSIDHNSVEIVSHHGNEDNCNSGDFKITYHTHPTLIDAYGDVDNGVTVPSLADMLGVVYDDYRNSTGYGDGSTNPSGVLDIITSDSGIMVYGSDGETIKNIQPILTKGEVDNPDINKFIEDVWNTVESTYFYTPFRMDNRTNPTIFKQLFQQKSLSRIEIKRINSYLSLMRKNGFIIDFIPWSDAMSGFTINFSNQGWKVSPSV